MEELLYIPFRKPDTTADKTSFVDLRERVFSTKEEMNTHTVGMTEYDKEAETDALLKIKRLTEMYVTLLKKTVNHAHPIVDHCETFIINIKSRIREACDHVIEEDDVEIGYERMAHVIFCIRCETLFN